MSFSPEELTFFDGLWDDDVDACCGEEEVSPSTTLDDDDDEATTSTSISTTIWSPSALQLEEKLLSLENGVLDTASQELVVGQVQNADPSDLGAILAKDMSRLSIQERELVWQDIHGTSNNNKEQPREDPEMVERALQQLDDCLGKLISNNKDAYNLAQYLAPNYVRNRSFRLMFLRGEEFHVENTAKRLLRHFDEKRKLFGPHVLGRNIRLSDLNDLDRATLNSGGIQLLPSRDCAGRALLCILPIKLDPKAAISRVRSNRLKMSMEENDCRICIVPCLEYLRHVSFPSSPSFDAVCLSMYASQQRCMWYIAMTGLRDETTQKNGVIVIRINVAPHRVSLDQVPYIIQQHHISEAVPRKLVAMHYCYDVRMLTPLLTFTRFLFGSRLRGRFVTHFGSHAEYSYGLQSYGIPAIVIPIDAAGNIRLQDHLDWIERRQVHEDAELQRSKEAKTGIRPRRFDVLFGRGRTVSEHTGNLRAFQIVEMNLKPYEAAGKLEKTLIAERIVHLIHESYGRFLKRDKSNGGSASGWVEATPAEARGKISHCFRRLREVSTLRSELSVIAGKTAAASAAKADRKSSSPTQSDS
jgi:hypothetical protein